MDGLAIGRIVHFTDESCSVHAAVVTRVHDQASGSVNLTYFPDDEINPVARATHMKFSEPREPGTWRWPPRD